LEARILKNNHSPAAEYNRIMWERLKKRMKKDAEKTTFEEKVEAIENRHEKPPYIL
jgi:hypothetical protein